RRSSSSATRGRSTGRRPRRRSSRRARRASRTSAPTSCSARAASAMARSSPRPAPWTRSCTSSTISRCSIAGSPCSMRRRPPAAEARVAASMVFALTLRKPQRRDIEQWVERALGRARHAAEPNLQMSVGLLCALTLMWTGLHPRAEQLIEQARRAAAAGGVSPFSRITVANVAAMHYMLTAKYEPGLQAMREGLEIARATGVHTWTFQLLVHGYGTALGAGDLETGVAITRELAPLAPQAGRLSQVFYHHFQ